MPEKYLPIELPADLVEHARAVAADAGVTFENLLGTAIMLLGHEREEVHTAAHSQALELAQLQQPSAAQSCPPGRSLSQKGTAV